MRLDAMILVFWILSFKQTFSLSSFTFFKRLFSSYSLSAIRVLSSAYLRLLIFLIQSCFQLAFHLAWHFAWCILHINYVSKVTIYSFDILLFQFWTNFHFMQLYNFSRLLSISCLTKLWLHICILEHILHPTVCTAHPTYFYIAPTIQVAISFFSLSMSLWNLKKNYIKLQFS